MDHQSTFALRKRKRSTCAHSAHHRRLSSWEARVIKIYLSKHHQTAFDRYALRKKKTLVMHHRKLSSDETESKITLVPNTATRNAASIVLIADVVKYLLYSTLQSPDNTIKYDDVQLSTCRVQSFEEFEGLDLKTRVNYAHRCHSTTFGALTHGRENVPLKKKKTTVSFGR